MRSKIRFRILLPVVLTTLSVVLYSWGIQERNAILTKAGSWGWHSTAVYHVCPLPFRVAVVLNRPAAVVVALLALPIDRVWPGRIPNVVAYPFAVMLVYLLWYLVGRRIDRRIGSGA